MIKPKQIPPYYTAVIDVVKLIPIGKVTNYGSIADFLALGSARMVGWALHKSGLADGEVPAHRVLNRNGELSGRKAFKDPTYMQRMLESEGIEIVNHKVKHLSKHHWHPEELLNE